jgi:hypothetical protein
LPVALTVVIAEVGGLFLLNLHLRLRFLGW